MEFKMMRSSLDNCLQVCLASILSLDIDIVPNFNHYSSNEWIGVLNSFLEKQMSYYALLVSTITDCNEPTPVRGLHLIFGEANSNGIYHSVIGLNGKMVHDPSPTAGGLKKADVYCVILPIISSIEKKEEEKGIDKW